MSKFDSIIGYAIVKKELRCLVDTLKNRDAYSKLGVKAPRGLLLHGVPGVGKSLMASAVIEESGLPCFTCRKDRPNGEFVNEIKATFDKAAANAPSIVFLDDMDKFSNSDPRHPDTEEYVTVQSCIDEVKGKDVFVLATANNIRNLPASLRRAGRFDRIIRMSAPHGKDAEDIIRHYLSNKQFVADVDAGMLARILDGHSCATLETVVNEAGLIAGYERSEHITMDHLVMACLQHLHGITLTDLKLEEGGNLDLSDPNITLSQVVYHEAGHAVVSEILCPESVTLVCAGAVEGVETGVTCYYRDMAITPLYWAQSRVVGSLGGMAAVEHKYGISDAGVGRDLEQAFEGVQDLITKRGTNGFALFGDPMDVTAQLQHEQEKAIAIDVEKYFRKAKEILSQNNEYFEKVAQALACKKLLTAVDMAEIKSTCRIVPVTL